MLLMTVERPPAGCRTAAKRWRTTPKISYDGYCGVGECAREPLWHSTDPVDPRDIQVSANAAKIVALHHAYMALSKKDYCSEHVRFHATSILHTSPNARVQAHGPTVWSTRAPNVPTHFMHTRRPSKSTDHVLDHRTSFQAVNRA